MAKEKNRSVYATENPASAADLLTDAIDWCTAAESGPELRAWPRCCDGGEPRSWPTTPPASNGPVEAANLLIKQVKRSGRGFRNMANYRLRMLLAGGQHPCKTQHVTSIRPRRPRVVA